MTEAELRHAVGDRVYDAFAPQGHLYNHDAEDPDNLLFIGETKHGEEVEINKRAAESDLIVYVNINLVSMDGGWKSTATGLSSYKSLRHHHNVKTMQHSTQLHGPPQERAPLVELAHGRGAQEQRHQGLPDRDDAEQRHVRHVRPDVACSRSASGSGRPRTAPRFIGMKAGLDRLPMKARRKIFNSWQAPYGITSVQAGEVEAVHEVTTENVFKQQLVEIEGQTDILTMGLPYICPYNVNSIMNPILVMCLGLGYFFNMYRGQAARARGRRADHEPPDAVGVPPRPPPELHRLLRAGAVRDDRSGRDREPLREAVGRGRVVPPPLPDELRLPRRPPVLHVVLGQPRPAHLGKVIIVGGEPRSVRRLGFTPASTLNDALEMAADVVGRDATITHLHNPPIVMADVV